MNPPTSLSAPGSVDMQSPELDSILTQIKGSVVPVITPSHACNLSGDARSNCVLTAEQTRAARFLQAVESDRTLTDREILQHARDCARLMEAAYRAYEVTNDPQDRQRAMEWLKHRDEALNRMSAEWKAAREAEIQEAIGVDYFFQTADKARESRLA